MGDRSNIDIIKDSYAAFGRGDLEAILRDVDPNIEWEEAGPKEIPWAGSFRGHDGVKRFFATIDAEAEIHSFEPQTFIADGNNVVVLGFEKIRSKRTGRTHECNWAHVFTVAGGKIVKFREYTDTSAIASAFRKDSTALKLRQCWILALAPLVVAAWFCAAATADDPLTIKNDRPQLFLHDDYLVAKAENLELKLGQVEKHPANPILHADRPWESGGLSYLCAYYDEEEKVYKLWYESRQQDQGTLCYATSKDGIHWTKPSLGLVEFAGSTDNNLVFPAPTGKRRHKVFWVVKDYSEPDPQKRYKMLYHLWDFRGRGVGVAHSPDGLRWTAPPYTVLRGTFDTHNVMFWDDRIGQFVGYFRWSYFGIRNIARSTSSDGFHWSEPEWVHGPDAEDGPKRDLYTPGIYKYNAAQNVYAMLTSAWDSYPVDTFTVQLGLSRDGIHWRRFRQPFIPHGAQGSWDSGSIIVSPSEITINGRTAFYYLGSVKAHEIPDPQKVGMGLAFMRRDAFVGYRAAGGQGVLTTRTLRIGRGSKEGEQDYRRGYLQLNLDLDGGTAVAEVLDAAGKPYPGYSFGDCKPVTSSGRAQPVAWNAREDLTPLLGKPVQLRLQVSAGTLYGFTVKDRK